MKYNVAWITPRRGPPGVVRLKSLASNTCAKRYRFAQILGPSMHFQLLCTRVPRCYEGYIAMCPPKCQRTYMTGTMSHLASHEPSAVHISSTACVNVQQVA